MKITDEMVEAGLAHYAEGGCSGLDERERREVVRDILEAALSAAPASAEHPDDVAVDRFAEAMKAKLAKKRAEGRGGWEDKEQCSREFLSTLLREHVDKGDPLDIMNFAMMLHQRGETVAQASAAEPVKMKPLEWEDCCELGWCADTIVGRYWVEQVHVAFRTRLVTLVAENETWIDIVDGKGFEAAKNAAQADYEARIRSAILPIDT